MLSPISEEALLVLANSKDSICYYTRYYDILIQCRVGYLMKKNNLNNMLPTNDLIIRSALKEDLGKRHAQDKKLRIIEELGVIHPG